MLRPRQYSLSIYRFMISARQSTKSNAASCRRGSMPGPWPLTAAKILAHGLTQALRKRPFVRKDYQAMPIAYAERRLAYAEREATRSWVCKSSYNFINIRPIDD